MKEDIDKAAIEKCVFEARYKKVGVNQWIRTGNPDIDVDLPGNLREEYKSPRVEVLDGIRLIAIVRVFDEKAVDLNKTDLLGDYADAARICDEALKARFPGDVIVERLSRWHIV